MFLGFIVLLLAAGPVWGGDPEVFVMNPIHTARPVEHHHSLHSPLDQSQVYWKYGGSTVLSRRRIQLTPAGQNLRGWLVNDYPIEALNWECAFRITAKSKPHFGGDGMGFWLLRGENGSMESFNDLGNTGVIFGNSATYNGVGVVFDVYDNDGRRDNPSVFVLQNFGGRQTNYNHDTDYMNDMLTKSERLQVPGTDGSIKEVEAHRCIVNLRNQHHPINVIVQYIDSVLRVYIDANTGKGFKFCLAVRLEQGGTGEKEYAPPGTQNVEATKSEKDKSLVDYHIVFTAATGQVADDFSIHDIATRYLDATSPDELAARAVESRLQMERTGLLSSLVHLAAMLLSLGLAAIGVYQWQAFTTSSKARIDPVLIAQRLNAARLPEIAAHSFITLVSLSRAASWWFFIGNLALVLWRGQLFLRRKHLYDPYQIPGGDSHRAKARGGLVPIPYALTGLAVLYAMLALHQVNTMFHLK